MNPYQAIQGPFDFTDPQHIKAYNKCTRALVNVHNGPFLEELQCRMEISGGGIILYDKFFIWS